MDLRYPIGQYDHRPFSAAQKEKWLQDLRFLPDELEAALLNMDEAQLDTPYREGGWKVKQLVHHVADSHLHAYTRFKAGLTEQQPVIKTYEEKDWAILDDVERVPVNVSLTLLHALHQRWVAAIQYLEEEQWQRTLIHPGLNKTITLWYLLGMYAWHGRHHVAHITTLRERNGW